MDALISKIREVKARAIDPDRAERAEEVKADYFTEYVGSQAWVVVHPNEPERAYLVDMIERTCSCPDFVCTANGLEIDCKHLLAVIPLWEKLTGLKDTRTEKPVPAYEKWFVPVMDPDPDDPYKD